MSIQLQHNDPTVYATVERIETYGGGFAAQLMSAFKKADASNKQRIIDAFPELFEQYGPNSVFVSQSRSMDVYETT